MTAWVLLVTAGVNLFTVPGIATQADCDTLAAALQQGTNQALNHSCVSYEQASTVSEVHVFGPARAQERQERQVEAPQFQFKKGSSGNRK